MSTCELFDVFLSLRLQDPRRTALGYSLKRLRDDDDEEEKQNEEEKEQEVAAIGFDAVRQLLLQEVGR